MWMKGITGQVLTSATSGFTAKLNLSGCILLIKKKKDSKLGGWCLPVPWCPTVCDLAQLCSVHTTVLR